MHPWAERSGIEAVALTDIERGEEEARRNARAWNHWEDGVVAAPNGPLPSADWLVRQSLELAELCRGADLLIATAIRVQGGIACEISGVPWLTFSLNPAAFATPGSPGEAWRNRSFLTFRRRGHN